MTDSVVDPAAALVDPQGQPASRRTAEDKRCPRCKTSPERRRPSGFGQRYPICGQCGYEFSGERWTE